MAYRNIKVNGKAYQYVIGAKFTKIKNLGTFENSKIGAKVEGWPVRYAVTPFDVMGVIKHGDQYRPRMRECEEHNVRTNELTVNPFNLEIGNRSLLMANCPQCADRLSWDI